MSEKIKEKLGEELYNKILEAGIKANEFDLLDGYIPRQRLNEVSGKLKATEEKITSYEKQIADTTELLKGTEGIKDQYKTLQDKYSNDLAQKDKEITNIFKRSVVKEKLIENGAKHPDLLLKEIDLEGLSIDGKNLIGSDEIIKTLKTNYSDLFIVKKDEGIQPPKGKENTPPGGWDFTNL